MADKQKHEMRSQQRSQQKDAPSSILTLCTKDLYPPWQKFFQMNLSHFFLLALSIWESHQTASVEVAPASRPLIAMVYSEQTDGQWGLSRCQMEYMWQIMSFLWQHLPLWERVASDWNKEEERGKQNKKCQRVRLNQYEVLGRIPDVSLDTVT